MGPKTYRGISNIFTLPTRRTLNRITENIYFRAGFNEAIIETLKAKINTFEDLDKNCCLCLDEMSIKSHLFYNIGADEIVGFEDNGNKKILRPALNVLVLMVKGLYNKWKQAFAYFFVHNTCTAVDLKTIIATAILKLKGIGLMVRAVVNDMGASNVCTANMLGVTADNPTFQVGEEEIVYLFDPPHLIKSIRNNLMSKTFNFDGKSTSWIFIEAFYNFDKKLQNRLAPKLTDAHMHPSNMDKMKVHLATQVLSATVVSGMTTHLSLGQLPAEAAATIEVIELFDKLFDILNSSRNAIAKEYNRSFKGLQYQNEFLNKMLTFLNKVTVTNKNGKDVTNTIKSINGFKITIKGVMVLWNKLNNLGFQNLYTRQLCQDASENYFGSVRQQSGNAVNPTPIQFQKAFKKLFSLDSFNSSNQNCSPDLDEILQLNIGNCKKYEEKDRTTTTNDVHISLKDCDYHLHKIEQNSIRYICGYLMKKCLAVHTCSVCEKYAHDHEELDETSLYCHFRSYQTKNKECFGNLYMPNDNFFYYICQLEQIFQQNFERLALSQNILANFGNLYSEVQLKHPCANFPLIYLVKLYSRMKLFYCLKFVNSNFKVTNEKGEKLSRKRIIWRHT